MVPISITEKAIPKYGHAALSTWAYAYHRCRNGVVYRGCDDQRLEKFGWRRSKFFQSMQRLVEVGLAWKDEWGNWRLLAPKAIRKKHRCTLLLSDSMSERDIRDQLVLKMVEMGHRQVCYKVEMPLKKRIKEERRMMLEPARTRTMLLADAPMMGRSKRDVVKLVRQGWAPMNTKTLCRVSMLGKHGLQAWKKRAKTNKWIKQKDHSEDLLPALYGLLPDDTRVIEREYRGAVSFSPSLNSFRFHQASCYKLLTSYEKN